MIRSLCITLLLILSLGVMPNGVHAQADKPDPLCAGLKTKEGTIPTCCDGIDNQINDGKDYGFGINLGDGKADFYGVAIEKNGKPLLLPADPICIRPDSDEVGDEAFLGGLVPCVNKCGFPDIIRLINIILVFLIQVIFLPLLIIMIIYAGYLYLFSGGNSSKVIKLKSVAKHVIIGFVIIMVAWLVVRVFFQTIGVDQGLLFLE